MLGTSRQKHPKKIYMLCLGIGYTQTFTPKKFWVLGMGLGIIPKPKPETITVFYTCLFFLGETSG